MPTHAILKIVAKADTDLVVARFRTRQIADLADMSTLERTRLVTAVSEIVRNALTYAGEARIEFNIDQTDGKQFVEVIVSDRGPGFPANHSEKHGGIFVSKKLVQDFSIKSENGMGTSVRMTKQAGKKLLWVTESKVEEWICLLKKESPFSVVEDLEQQNKQLIDTLTELEATKSQLEDRSEQLNQANKYKGEFLANMSHEIRTPMNAVIGMSNILERTELSEEQRKYLKLIKNASGSLLDIINDILDFSKIEAGKLVIENISFDLYDVVESCVELLSTNAQAKGLALLCWIDPDVPRHVMGDFVRLRQVLVNLINNGIKFTAEGEIITRLHLLKRGEKDARVRFEVIDSGIGLAEEKQKALFKPFVQADGSTTRKYGGTGLGLSICKQLTDLMGGIIGVDSVEGAGSTFWFELPYNLATERKSQPIEKPLSFKHALIVDDHAPMREMAGVLLNSWKVKHQPASSAAEALKLAEKTDFDLMIIDYMMPGMNGLELVTKLRALNKFANSRIVLLTALHEGGLGEKAIATGCNAFLTKPVRQSQLYDCLRSLSESGTYTVPPIKKATDTAETSIRARVTDSSPGQSINNVLLVEDNPTNQIVAGIELSELGFKVSNAKNGAEAVEMISKNNYALVFMDCQMPVMDGYEATRIIRKKESKTGKHVPIIAMTANAMEGDRELCLSAGMDDYITKPFLTEDLIATIERWIKLDTISGTASAEAENLQVEYENTGQSSTSAVEGDSSNQNIASEPAIDYDRLRAKFNDKQANQLLTVFIADTEKRLPEFEPLIEQRDYDAIAKHAHSIKGAASMIFAESLAATAREMEARAKAGDSSVDYTKLYQTLTCQVKNLRVSAEEILSLKL
jgi:signal transduction histidine kinase/DNA-binding response OmpR family regulator